MKTVSEEEGIIFKDCCRLEGNGCGVREREEPGRDDDAGRILSNLGGLILSYRPANLVPDGRLPPRRRPLQGPGIPLKAGTDVV